VVLKTLGFVIRRSGGDGMEWNAWGGMGHEVLFSEMSRGSQTSRQAGRVARQVA
jgi:hypothetical protein